MNGTIFDYIDALFYSEHGLHASTPTERTIHNSHESRPYALSMDKLTQAVNIVGPTAMILSSPSTKRLVWAYYRSIGIDLDGESRVSPLVHFVLPYPWLVSDGISQFESLNDSGHFCAKTGGCSTTIFVVPMGESNLAINGRWDTFPQQVIWLSGWELKDATRLAKVDGINVFLAVTA